MGTNLKESLEATSGELKHWVVSASTWPLWDRKYDYELQVQDIGKARPEPYTR